MDIQTKVQQDYEMFAFDEALEFVQNVLGVNSVSERLRDDRRGVVDEIVQRVQEKIPFQSITLLSLEDMKKRSSYDEIKNRCTSGVGGLCYDIAPFTCGLFKALGFSVQMVSTTVHSGHRVPMTHVAVLLYRLASDSDVHIIDCATGFATFRAISLNFNDESPVFNDSFCEYQYIRNGEKIHRMHGKGDMQKRNDPPIDGVDFYIGHWRRFYTLETNLISADLHKPADVSHRNVTSGCTVLTSSPRAIWFPRKRAVVIVNNKLMLENMSGELVTTPLGSDDEIVKAYGEHFPQFEEKTVRRALEKWHRATKP